MKRNNLGYVNKNNNQIGGKEFWDYSNNNNGDQEYYMNGFPWPPRSYTCTFCRKEFKSAQALGGHMNVHRRDRARMRQSSSPPNEVQVQGHQQAPFLNLNINPSSLSSPTSQCLSSSSNVLKPVTCTLPLFVSSNTPSTLASASSSPSELKRTFVVVDGMILNPNFSTKVSSESTKVSKIGEDGCKILKMDLEIGLARDYDLDLELRLGTYS